MTLKYTTETLPLNYLMLGFTLLIVGIITILHGDYEGICALILAIPLLFIRSGLIINSDGKQVKKYIGLFTLCFGKWIDTSTASHLQIARIRQNQGMWVASISRNEVKSVHKLFLIMDEKRIELLTGKQDKVEKIAYEIAKHLKLDLRFPTK